MTSALMEHSGNVGSLLAARRQAREERRRQKRIVIFCNGDIFFKGKKVSITPNRYVSYNDLLQDLTYRMPQNLYLPNGVRQLFSPSSGRRLGSISDLRDGGAYVCAGNETFKPVKYGAAELLPWGKGAQSSGNFDSAIYTGSSSQFAGYNAFPPSRFLKRQHHGQQQPQALQLKHPPESSRFAALRGSRGHEAGSGAGADASAGIGGAPRQPKVITVIKDGQRPRQVVKILLNRRGVQSFQQLLADISDSFGGGRRGGRLRRLWSIAGRDVRDVGDLFRDEEIFVGSSGEEAMTLDRVSDLLDELYPGNAEALAARRHSKPLPLIHEPPSQQQQQPQEPEEISRQQRLAEEQRLADEAATAKKDKQRRLGKQRETPAGKQQQQQQQQQQAKATVTATATAAAATPSDEASSVQETPRKPDEKKDQQQRASAKEKAKKESPQRQTLKTPKKSASKKRQSESEKPEEPQQQPPAPPDSQRPLIRPISSSRFINERFELGKTMGDGNFAIVRACVIDKSKLRGKEHMVINEVRIMKMCQHHNIVRLVEEYETRTEIYLVMELVKGGDLFDAISQVVKFNETQAAHMVADMANALFYLHSRNIVHRDLKPENLLVYRTKDNRISLKLGDFGLAMEVEKPIYTVCGTPTYVAPEILEERGECCYCFTSRRYGLEVDLWALGVITYILLCGFPPFRSRERRQTELFQFIKSGVFEFLSPYWDHISLCEF
uniref:non-specific serine/threonine protein kinase n=1 Tax=Macrostomum lignano TaxID=282301 RepID=A0A1I8HHZ5_9PLAT